MEKLTEYFKLQKEIYDYFGYEEDWCKFPISDAREFYWELNQNSNGSGYVVFAKTIKGCKGEDDSDCYKNSIYTQRFLKKWVYIGQDFTMILVDTHCDGNKFLQIFDNAKKIK
jgi:hypothetical protein